MCFRTLIHHCIQNPHGSNGIYLSSIFRNIKRNLYMALGTKIIDLGRLDLS